MALMVVAAVLFGIALAGLVELADSCFSRVGAGRRSAPEGLTATTSAGVDASPREWVLQRTGSGSGSS